MNRVIILVAILISFGCGNSESGDKDSRKEFLADYLNGFWLSDNYLNAIEQSKSIYKSRNYYTRFFGFTMEKENLNSNTPMLSVFSKKMIQPICGGKGKCITLK